MIEFKKEYITWIWYNIQKKLTASNIKFSDGETFQQKYERGELKGKDGVNGDEGLGIFYSTSTSTSTGSTVITISSINIPSGRNLKDGDLIINSKGNLYKVTSISSSYAYVNYVSSLVGPQGLAGTSVTTTTLYKNEEGTKDSITLSEDSNNYNYIEIIYKVAGLYKSVKVECGTEKQMLLDGINFTNDTMYLYTTIINLSGKSLNVSRYETFSIKNSTSWQPYGSPTNNVSIIKVIGYK